MSTVELMGLIRAQNKAKRSNKELSHHQEQEMTTSHNWIAQDKQGKCYTYRGVSYCYN